MSASSLNATYVWNPIGAINVNTPYPGSCFRIQSNLIFGSGLTSNL